MGPTHNNQNGPGGPKKGGRLKSPHRYIHSAPWWRWILLLLCLLFTDTTAQPEHSQFPLVEMATTTFQFF